MCIVHGVRVAHRKTAYKAREMMLTRGDCGCDASTGVAGRGAGGESPSRLQVDRDLAAIVKQLASARNCISSAQDGEGLFEHGQAVVLR